MASIRTVKLELLRPGPSHNQLLSPLTPYIALCGNASPTTLYIRQEHHRFLSKLERLRYATSQGSDLVAVPNRLREAAVVEVGHDVAAILNDIPSLLGEVSRVAGSLISDPATHGAPLVHVSLVLGGSELALIPFELAVAPDAYPGEGLELVLQPAVAIVPTRETRRMLLQQPSWDSVKEPRLLLVAAAPDGLDIPLAGHVHAIREAFEPWIKWPRRLNGQDIDRLDEVKKRIRVLPNASIEAIYQACSEESYTHVHILAHGGEYEHAGERQFGLVLCAHDDPARAAVVSGKHLAKALRAEGTDGSRRSNPMVVTLATCDSGNPGSVLGPGGSLAHDLHSEGIPWVFASQFPLTKAGSVDMARALYPGLLRGDDPRQVLYEMRRRLYLQFRSSHDWAGIVVYASVPSDFERSVVGFFEQQSRNAIEVSLGRADDLPEGDEQNQRLADARRVLDRWRANLPAGDHVAARERRAECYGIHGSTFKRIALMEYRTEKLRGDKTLREAMQHYRAAMAEGAVVLKFHWVATQALALAAALKDKPDPETFELAWHVARQGLHNPAPAERAWAHGTLAELEMISLHHKKLAASASQDIQDKVVSHCRDMLRLMGKTSFHVESTRRQFQRYVDHWNKRFTPIAQAAVDALS